MPRKSLTGEGLSQGLWLVVFVLLVAILLTAGHLIALALVAWAKTLLPAPGIVLLASALFVTLLAVLYRNRLHLHGLMIAVALLAVLSGNVMAAGTHELLDGPAAWVGGGVALALCSLALHAVRRKLTTYRTIDKRLASDYLQKPGHGVKALVLLLSRNEQEAAITADRLVIRPRPGSQPLELQASGFDVVDQLPPLRECEPVKLRWNWEQVLRAVRPHLRCSPRVLERIYLLGSRDTGSPPDFVPGSSSQLDACAELLSHLLQREQADSVEVHQVANVDFEDFESVTVGVRS